MEELNFRIVVVPTTKCISDAAIESRNATYLVHLKQLIESCGLTEVNLNILKVKKQDEDEYPEIEELMFQSQAKCLFTGPKQTNYVYYKELCSQWRNALHPSIFPILVLHENGSFNKQFKSYHSPSCKNFAFGVLPYNGTFYEYNVIEPPIYLEMHVDFQHDLRQFKIKHGGMEFISSYNAIKNIFVNIDSNPREVYFDLCDPPLVFQVEQKYSRYIGNYTISHRTTLPDVPVDVFGRSNVLRISFSHSSDAEEIVDRIHFRCGEKPIHYAVIQSLPMLKPMDPVLDMGHFGCTYLMTAIFRRNFTMAAQAVNINIQLSEVKRLCQENSECLEKALILVLAALDSGTVVNFWHAIENQYRYYRTNRDEIDYRHYVVPEKCRMIRRITLTPTRQLLWPPEIMFSNRVLRNFDSEFAVRVSFRDDNNSRLSFVATYSTDEIFQNSIRGPMTKGIFIGARQYKFLAWSNSQIRDHGIWMYAVDRKENTVSHIRKWMGDFSHIKSVPKYMARMGQCFSQTEDSISVPLDLSHVRFENDIEGGLDLSGKRYCFSDGVGRISTKLANEVRNALGHDKLCSAFQIRYGGCKGMLVVDPTLKDTDIVFRKSMKKFESPLNTRLEIAKTSAPIRLQLNRPFITILNDMGVRHRTFLKLQEKVLRNLTDMLFEEEIASAFLTSKTPSGLFCYNDLSKSGVYLTTEPFFRSLLLALHRQHVEKIKIRANIAIDPSEGRNMLGVMDETGLLNPGEVFVQYTKDIEYGETTKNTIIVKQEVLVTKNPCMLPGDVRKFKAVDIPRLRHIVDCIVFPQKGSRPHPNEMGGSDLDGDEYTVLWNKDLIFFQQNAPPGHFPSAIEEYKEVITETDMIDFLIKYIKNDQVGAIANAHLAHADNLGISSPCCINIAQKFSFAVDFAKTGSSRPLDREERPSEFPDFMENYHKETYKSQKALGKMFRVTHDYESENESASISYIDIKVDPDLKYPGWEKYKEDAIKSRNKFNTLLKTVLRNYGIQHEAEAFSGAFTKLHCRFQERKDRDEIEKVVVRSIKRLSKCMNEEFLEEFTEMGNLKEISDRMLQKASAWYVVTYGDKNAKFLSFPWTVSKILANIKIRGKGNGHPLYFSPIIHNFDERIQFCVLNRLLPPYSGHELREYNYACDPSIVEQALRVLILWAEDEQIIEKSGHSVGFLFVHVFVRLFLYVAERSSYICKRERNILPDRDKHYSVATLCVEFFKFCLTLRFYSKHVVKEVLPFPVYKYMKLSKQAVLAYHRFAVQGKFQNLYFDAATEENITEMKQIHIDSKIFVRHSPIDGTTLSRAENALVKHSFVEKVQLREIRQTKKVIVSARGTEQSLKNLKGLLRKKHVFLAHLFTTGELPAEKI